MLDFSNGSYAGRMHPPGRPNMISTFSISRDRMSASAPVSVSLFDIVCLLVVIDFYELGLRNEKTTRMGGF